MLVGLDALPLTEPLTGVGHYTLELSRALARTAPDAEFELVYPSTYPPIDASLLFPSPAPVNLRLARISTGAVGRHWWALGLPRYLRPRGINLFHGTNYDVPLWRRSATVLTIHDLSLFSHSETHEAPRVRRARRRLPLMTRVATMIVTPSESVREEVCARFRVATEKVVAVPEAARAIFRRVSADDANKTLRRLGIEGDFLLAVGTIEPRKNLPALIRAFESVVRALPGRNLRLVVAGGGGWLSDPLFAEVDRSTAKDRIVFAGYLGDEDLRALYSSCLMLVYPSLYEGFGLPVVEAMQCGAAVVTSKTSALAETAGGAALLVDPLNEEEIAAAIVRLVEDDNARHNLSEAGSKRAGEFSWERTARMTMEVYREALRRF
jgi:glycosyltransferase involved in cell wall biosynthesis